MLEVVGLQVLHRWSLRFQAPGREGVEGYITDDEVWHMHEDIHYHIKMIKIMPNPFCIQTDPEKSLKYLRD